MDNGKPIYFVKVVVYNEALLLDPSWPSSHYSTTRLQGFVVHWKRPGTVYWEIHLLQEALLLTPTLGTSGTNQPFTVNVKTPGLEMLLLHHSPHLRWAVATSPLLSYSRVLFPVWTLVPGHSLANLYNSPSVGLNVPPYERLLKIIGINEITAQPERPSSLYENQLIRHVFLFYWLHFRGLLIKWSLSDFTNSFRN